MTQLLTKPSPTIFSASDQRELHGAEQSADAPRDEASYRFVHTDGFAELLQALGGSLIVTTYQAGKLVTFRAREGRVSMLLRTFDKAMGVAVAPDRLAVATEYQIWSLHNAPEVAAKMKPAGHYDGCFLPRTSHVTGNIDVHEIAWGADDDVWVVNTQFSCLCTLDPQYSFVPRWRPPFVSGIKRQDACHLNGLAMVDGRPKYVTAFGETNDPEGWRPGKADGGVVIDVDSGETIARGLSMPHSPRVHQGRLYVLDSGRGRLCCVDPANGQVETVAELPGYTRGLAFAGRVAFVGLSKIRESSIFGGIPIAEQSNRRICGVSVVDLVTGGVIQGIEFEETVEEVFDVQILPGVRFPAVVGFNKDTIQRACVIAPEREMN